MKVQNDCVTTESIAMAVGIFQASDMIGKFCRRHSSIPRAFVYTLLEYS